MRSWNVALVLLLCACGGGEGADSGPASDGGADAPSDLPDAAPDGADDVGADANVEPPVCERTFVPPPACGSGAAAHSVLFDHDALGDEAALALADKASRYDRGFAAIGALHTGVGTEVNVADAEDRETIRRFYQESDSWDLAAFAGQPVESMVSWRKVAGAFAGAGVGVEAFRYGALRDGGADCARVDRARDNLRRALEGLHRATAITGAEGVFARGYQRSDVPGFDRELTPLFDDAGNPLPEEKNNGEWRADQSGEYADYAWEDSCSRDMLVGWVFGLASAWEVVEFDPAFEEERARLRQDALALARRLMRVGEEGFDLEIPDADGRVTFHGFLHEDAIDRTYIRGFGGNSQHAAMSLGMMAALAYVSGDAAVASYVHNELILRRELHHLIRESVGLIDFGLATNFSNYNMTFTGAWLASRYVCDGAARDAVNEGIVDELYGGEADARHPVELAQSLFDLIYIAARSEASAYAPGRLSQVDDAALRRSLQTLADFPDAPYWEEPRENCDAEEVAELRCVAVDGETTIELLAERGWNDEIIAREPVPIHLRPASNFHWRSNPFRVNDTRNNAEKLLSGVDYRLAYWMGRYVAMQ